ncbi:hypothetical protein [Christiangramia sp. SM2212]|uniref:Uncharacterized protein n=1 Tax=Christiangramia sediminicola TaxID=3073267 RepID=A0ABU1EL06_9FLAO|nr:hypothetical protein [Christiangramia sp. SM2212]MDR5589069.1 hypothetical protein [Christiangramia sp. SM2212]
MSTKLSKGDYFKIFIIIMIIFFAYSIINDWEHFKAGLLGLSPNR